jgi:hypothetical protein
MEYQNRQASTTIATRWSESMLIARSMPLTNILNDADIDGLLCVVQVTDCKFAPNTGGNSCPSMIVSCYSSGAVLLWGTLRWQPSTHAVHPQALRDAIRTLFLLRVVDTPFYWLPNELMFLIVENVVDNYWVTTKL